MNISESQLNFKSRLRFLADVTALGFLCSPEAVTHLERAVEPLDSGHRRSSLRGYRLAVATPLHGLLWFVGDHPELLGFEYDDRLFNWLHYTRGKRKGSLLSAVSDPTSDLGRLCYVFNDLQVALRRADSGLADTVVAIEKCGVVAARFAEVLAGTEIISLNTGEELPDGESILRAYLAERILDYLDYDRSIVALALELVWSGGEEFRPIDDRFVLDAETHLDDVALFPSASGIPEEWGDSFWFGCDLVIQLNEIVLPSHSDSAPVIYQDWLKELRTFVNPLDQSKEWPSWKYGLAEFSQPSIGRLLDDFEVNMDTASSKNRLAAILGPDRVRLITSAGSTDPLELEIMLSGAVAARGDSRVRVLLLSHSVASDDREWVSVAFRLPMYGTALGSNASKWFLFYKMYHKGELFETDVVRAFNGVQELLVRFEDNLAIEKLDELDSTDFLPYCTLPAFRAMGELSLKAVEVNADLRSGNSELLAGLWLASQGYHNVRVSFKRVSLGKSDYDAIGVKDGQCLVMELKTTNVIDDKLQKEIDKFANGIDQLRSRLPVLAQALGCNSDIESVSGLFVFLGDLGSFKPAKPSVPLWGYDDFVEALKTMDLPNRIVGLLDRSYIIHSVQNDGFPDDPFFAGLEG